MQDDNLTQEGLEAIANDILTGSVESNEAQTNPDVAMELATELLGVGEEPSDQEPVEEPADQVSDETGETEESDDDSPVEAEADVEVDDEPTNDEDAFYVDYDEVKDAYLPIKIGGEVRQMKFGEIQNQLARAESASKKSQEANQRQEELDAREQQLMEQEEFLNKRSESYAMNDELATRVNHIRQMNAELDKAVSKNDSHNATLLRERINKATQEAQSIHEQVQQVNQAAQQRHFAEQANILKEKGYGGIINDNYINYVKTNASEEALTAINGDATLAIMAEKARKWDASQGKAKRTLKKSKSLPAGGGKISQAKSNEQQAKLNAMKAGVGKQSDALAGVEAIANDILFGDS